MASEKEIFSLSGPQHLNHVDWRNAIHRRCIMASLVKGVYVQEHDRQKNRRGLQALAPPWWETFDFHLVQVLVDNKDESYFGAIYEYKYSTQTEKKQDDHNPKYVIAFRGTTAKPDSISEDGKLDARVILNRLQNRPRFNIALQAVQNFVNNHGGSNIWLAGHSLGSAIASLGGRDMAKKGVQLESYLFNPPFVSLPIEKLFKEEKLKLAHSILTVRLGQSIDRRMPKWLLDRTSHQFTLLSSWTPYLFVNPSDLICSGYVGYFKHMEDMVKFGGVEFARLDTQKSLRSIIATARGKDSEPSQQLPSAYLTTNWRRKSAHALSQWWTPADLHSNTKLYKFW